MEAIIIVLMIVALALAVAMFVKMDNEIKSLKEEIDGVRTINKLNSKSLIDLAKVRKSGHVTQSEFTLVKTYTYGNIRNLWDHVHDLDRIIGLEEDKFPANEIEVEE